MILLRNTSHAKALAFAIRYLKKRGRVPFSQVQNAAKHRSLTLIPIVYGRALVLAGIVKGARGPNKNKQHKTSPQLHHLVECYLGILQEFKKASCRLNAIDNEVSRLLESAR